MNVTSEAEFTLVRYEGLEFPEAAEDMPLQMLIILDICSVGVSPTSAPVWSCISDLHNTHSMTIDPYNVLGVVVGKLDITDPYECLEYLRMVVKQEAEWVQEFLVEVHLEEVGYRDEDEDEDD